MSNHVREKTQLSRLLAPDTAKLLYKSFGYTTASELLGHFPREYMPHNQLSEFSQLREDDYVTFVGRVRSATMRDLRTKRQKILDVVVEGADGDTMTIGFFGAYTVRRQLPQESKALFQGKLRSYKGRPTLTNPSFDLISGPESHHGSDEGEVHPAIGNVLPLYPATAEISSMGILRAVEAVREQADFSLWLDSIPEHIRELEELPELGEAYRRVHWPESLEEPEQGWKRFRFNEALLLQGLMDRRRRLIGQRMSTPAPGAAEGRLAAFDAQLSFGLTEGQKHCGGIISNDISRRQPMNRLLQGEVGSGKTLVALRAMLQVIDSGAQAALVAPTEVLAAQHLRSVQRMLGALADETRTGLLAQGNEVPPVTIVMLTGSQSASEKRRVLLEIASGRADIVIGTHAVLGEKVQFAELGLAVIDEQHRFGVAQRNALRDREPLTPHMLVMSATPIPRSVAMTAFGDLELTTLTGLPSGRHAIDTQVVPTVLGPRWEQRVWERIVEEAAAGRQVYVVCPKISALERTRGQINAELLERFGMEDKASQVRLATSRPDGGVVYVDFTRKEAIEHITNDASVESIEELFAAHPELNQLRCDTVHGQMQASEAASVMTQFEAGSIRVLIATTVIEVGVDVPAATLMVILDADAFGTSTLHQLRGRIGRGNVHKNQCLLVTRMHTEHPSVQRLQEIAEHSDGMQLALLDLKRRREGDVLGAAQSGTASTLKRLRILKDADVIEAAASHIATLSAQDPQWSTAPALWRAVEDWRLEHEDAEEFVHHS